MDKVRQAFGATVTSPSPSRLSALDGIENLPGRAAGARSAPAYMRGLRAVLAAGGAISALASGAAYAQQASAPEGAAIEEIVVTGSSIRGVAPVGSPIIGLTRESLNASAPTNVKDMLSTVPALGNFGTNAEQSTPNRFRTTGFIPNIHNLGVYATLTLVNGHRVAGVGTEGTFPDPSTVPPIAIQRTEIVADGASAIYGSDAVAGVVNFIYRKPFNGFEAQSTYSFDNETRYRRREISAIGGRLWDGGGVMVAYGYSDNLSPTFSEIPALARAGDHRSVGGRDLRGNACPTPLIRGVNARGVPTGTTYGSSAQNFTTDAAAQRCGFISDPYVIPDTVRHALLVTADHQLNDRVKIWGELNHGYNETEFKERRGNIAATLSRTSPYFTAQNIPPALFNNPAVTQVSVTRSAIGLLSPETTTIANSRVVTAVAGVDVDLGADWKATVSLNASGSRNFHEFIQLDQNNILAAVNTTDRNLALNLFGQAADTPAAVLASIDNRASQKNYGQNRLAELTVKADGPIYTLPAGEVRAAIGASFRNEGMSQTQISGSDAPNSGYRQITRNDRVSRSIGSLFAELNIPLVSDQNELPLVKALTLSISGRYDNFDKYGGKFNPKYGAVWSPVQGLNLRGSYGTNFAAPPVGILGGQFGGIGLNANPNLVIGYGPYQGTLLSGINAYNIQGGNPNLQPEEAKTQSFGFDYTPTVSVLSGLRVGVTWYHVEYSNLITQPLAADLITNPNFAAYTEFFPTAERIAQLATTVRPTVPITIPLGNFQLIQTTGAINLGSRIFEGMDYDISYRLPTDSFGNFNFGISANQQLKFKQEVNKGTGYQSRLNTLDAVKWKVRYSLGWNFDAFSANLFVNYTHGYDNVSVNPIQKVDAFVTTDLSAAYEFKSLLKGVTLQGRVQNLFDKDPPFYDSTAGYNGGLASPFPRSFDITLRAKF